LHTSGNYFNKEIRPKTLGIVYRGEDLLVEKYDDIVKSETFYRFLGGGINFQEKAEIALAREFKEEINATIKIIDHKVTLENIFSFGDSEEHEIVFIYEIMIDEHFYVCDKFEKTENNVKTDVYWIDKKKFINGELILYPVGVLSYI
jgi:8-oxo-dGTP pyrophosphatase MutT (NUDIX family)